MRRRPDNDRLRVLLRGRLSLDRVQVLRRRRRLDRGEIGIGAEHPVGGAGAGDGEPVVLVLEVVLSVITPDRPIDKGFRLVVAVDQVVASTRRPRPRSQ